MIETINFKCNQFQLAQMMITIGAVGLFDEMERTICRIDQRRCSNTVRIKNGSDRRMLENMLTALKINYVIECYFGVQQDA
jgi:hypothetical protein